LELHYVRLFFRFTPSAELSDPYCLFAARADFDAAFRRALSCRKSDCAGCLAAANCPYPANFGQKIARDPEAVRRHQKPPLPFVFRFPVLPAPPNRGCELELALTLFGSAAQYAGRYVAAVRTLLEGLPAATLSVEAESPGGVRTLVAALEHPPLPLLSALDPSEAGPLRPDRLTVRLLSPLKLLHEGRLLKEFTFAHFARTLMRRVSSLAYHYEGTEPPLDYRWLSEQSEKVETLARECRPVNWHGRPAGLVGSVEFGGNLEPFHLLLQMGLATQLGKGASFGFGCYRLEC